MHSVVTCRCLIAGTDNHSHRLIVCPEIIQNFRCQKVDTNQIMY